MTIISGRNQMPTAYRGVLGQERVDLGPRGRAAEPPTRVHLKLATAAPKRSASTSLLPSASASAKPPCSASPAPSVSTAWTENTGRLPHRAVVKEDDVVRPVADGEKGLGVTSDALQAVAKIVQAGGLAQTFGRKR